MKTCPKCGKQVEDDVKFCPQCGASLNEENALAPEKEETVKNEPAKGDIANKAQLAMIFGIISASLDLAAAFSILTLFGFSMLIPIGLGIPAIVLGAKTRKADKKGFAGFVLGIVGVALAAALIVAWVFVAISTM